MVIDTNSEIALASVHRIIRKFGAERVSDSAAEELRKVLEIVGEKVAKQVVELARHAHRKTIKAEDITLASKSILKY